MIVLVCSHTGSPVLSFGAVKQKYTTNERACPYAKTPEKIMLLLKNAVIFHVFLRKKILE